MSTSAKNVIPIYPPDEPAVQSGTVVSGSEEGFCIDVAGKLKTAKKAFSCIIDPEPDDCVILAQDNNGHNFILGIIDRPNAETANVSFPSDVNISSTKGNLTLSAPEQICVAARHLTQISQKAVHKGKDAVIAYDHVTASGTDIQASFKSARFICNLITTMARQAIDKFKGYVRHTEDMDMVNAGQMSRKIDGLYNVDSQVTLMNSKKTTKIDGDKILMG